MYRIARPNMCVRCDFHREVTKSFTCNLSRRNLTTEELKTLLRNVLKKTQKLITKKELVRVNDGDSNIATAAIGKLTSSTLLQLSRKRNTPPDHLSKTRTKRKPSATSALVKDFQLKDRTQLSVCDKPKATKRSNEKRTEKNEGLNSYIDVCVRSGLLNVAFGTLNRLVQLRLFDPKKSANIAPKTFNLLLQGYASRADVGKMRELMNMMESCDIKCTEHTYAACFECLGRSVHTSSNEKWLQKLYKQFKNSDLSFEDLMARCTLTEDQRIYVLKTIRILKSNFVWELELPPKNYSRSILNDLNANFSPYQSPVRGILTQQQLDALIKEQIEVESRVSVKIDSALESQPETSKLKLSEKKWKQLMKTWQKSLKNGFIKDLDALETRLVSSRTCFLVNVFPYLRALSVDEFVKIMMDEIHKFLVGSESPSYKTVSFNKTLGRRVKQRYDTNLNIQSSSIYKKYCEWYLDPETNPSSYNTRHEWQRLCSFDSALNLSCEKWPDSILEEIGKFLHSIILCYVKIDVNSLEGKAKPNSQYAFYAFHRYKCQRMSHEIKPNSHLRELYDCINSKKISFSANTLPMLSPPRPWTSIESGGYLLTKSDFIRPSHRFPVSSMCPNKSVPAQQLYGVFDSLNQLSSIPWRINEPILDLMLKVFREGGASQQNALLLRSESMDLKDSNQPDELYFQERYRKNCEKSERASLWTAMLRKLSLANYCRKRIFWLPHNLDFRGRTYTIPSQLSHYGSDLSRALLLFAKGEKLGPQGLDWLKIHCVNLTGLMKLEPLSKRLKYADEILPEILDSAKNPLTGNMWWTHSEDAWQTLACCMEIKSALESGDPENYICHFPIHQDGTCNGLQHYAALGRDEVGGKSVNLIPSDRPQDVYSRVVELVEKQRALDAQNGNSIAKALEGHINRKVIKKTVMTTVYGVTRYGARELIYEQLKNDPHVPDKLIWPGSKYLVYSTFNCVRIMFESTKLIQDWFVECAMYIANTKDEFVEWETPLGLVVRQPYGKVSLGSHSMKQRNAFPPNYIQSLDSSHMMLTSLHAERKGLVFVAVHDCFWTHPSSVKTMNKVCREQFVGLHLLPLLEDLSTYFVDKFGTKEDCLDKVVLTKIPQKGSLVLEDVLHSTYFFN